MDQIATTHIRIRVEDAVGCITIDRPERFNSLDVRTAQDLRHAGLMLARDPGVRVVILEGVNGVFCSGADLKYIRAGGEAEGGDCPPCAGARLAETQRLQRGPPVAHLDSERDPSARGIVARA